MNSIHQQLIGTLGDQVKVEEPLARYTTFKIGGPADYFFDAKTQQELIDAIATARKLGIPFFIVGGGTNILIGDRGIRGLVIKNSTRSIGMKGMRGSIGSGNTAGMVFVEADSGVSINKLVRFTIEEGLGGLEMHLGLPGSVGGAVYMNSKWTKPEGYVGDRVYQAKILTKHMEVQTVPQAYFRFAYDYSTLQRNPDIVLSVTFALRTEETSQLWTIANASIDYRRLSQPQGVFSAGCTFKNISKAQAIKAMTPNLTTSAGFLVDNAGLKGTRVGDAEISPVHANFIINRKSATAQEVVELIEIARSAVEQKFGVRLEEEIRRVGEF